MGMWRWIFLAVIGIGIVVFGLSLVEFSAGGDVSASSELLSAPTNTEGFARAEGAYDWQFPRDHGLHPDFQTEWWYYTGNLADDAGERFGFQFTIFRRAVTPDAVESESEWRTNQVYMAHFTVADVTREQFYQAQRFSRGGAGLAGATGEPLYRVWLEDWEVAAQDEDAAQTRIQASAGGVAIDLQLEQVKPPALQGEEGLSPKSDEPGNASYYYSLSRLLTEGEITLEGTTYRVTGTTWMDHEFSTSALGEDAQGWDWFGLHLDDNRELMLGRIRLVEGGYDPVFGGLLVLPDGGTRKLEAEDFTLTVTDSWTSPHTGATYPAGWEIAVEIGEPEPLQLTLAPLLADQELHEGIAYWEGAVRITGDVTGYGYAELTGYSGTMNGRF
ncbi:MAG: carotenoid 1,2-hydratase [Anaerolineae bacterium]|nr:carotenoid 1,2-hydratase [Anaerolineae bacterium]